jgi:hypothetical protein
MSPACLDLVLLFVRPHNDQTRSDVSSPDAMPHICHEASGFTFMLETHDDIIGVTHDDDLTSGLALSPLFQSWQFW